MGGRGVLKYEIGIFLPHCLKMGGLRSGPSLKMRSGGVLSERPLTGKTGDLGVKNNKETYFFFFKRRSFRSAEVGKAEQRMVYFKKGGLLEWPTSKE